MDVVFMIDMTGFQQSPENVRVPTPREIAIGLGRICRYSGILPCSVLTHTLIGAGMVWELCSGGMSEQAEQTFCWWILHDAHEYITGDFVVCKPREVREWQDKIDAVIREKYGIDWDIVDQGIIEDVDLYSRYLEAERYGSIAFFDRFKETNTYKKPSFELKRSVLGVLHGSSMDVSATACGKVALDEKLPFAVGIFLKMLEAVLAGEKRTAVELYDGAVMELGLE